MSDKYNVYDMLQKARVAMPSKQGQPLRSTMINPMSRLAYRSSKTVLEPNKGISYRILRTVTERAWIINAIISHQIRNVRPYLKPSTDKNIRGFHVVPKDIDRGISAEDKKLAAIYEQFFLRTGFGNDPEREDDLGLFCGKVIRDVLTLDQVATELQRTMAKRVCAFWAVDAATIMRTSEEGYNGDDAIRYIQEVDMVTTAMYTKDDLIFEFMNPRTDINHSGYGYSMVEQAIDLVTGLINSFMYNMGFFTEDKLPRGMLLLQGDADTEEVEMIEDYLVNIMSGGPIAKWHVPIIPAGKNSDAGGEGRKFEWVSLQGSNKDMEFSQWTEFLWSSITALFGVDLEELGIRTSKSTPIIGQNAEPRIEASKSRGLGSILGFLQGHFQKILDMVDPRFQFEFVGYEKDDPLQKNQMREIQLRTTKTIDEIRIEDNEEPFNQPWSQIPLNPYVIQMVQQQQQQQSMAGGQGAPGEQGEPNEDASEYGADYAEGGGGDVDAQQEGEEEAEPNNNGRGNGSKRSIYDYIQKSVADDVIEIYV